MNFGKRIDKILKESENDKYGGMSAGVDVKELYLELSNNEKNAFSKFINETLYKSNDDKLTEYVWIVSFLYTSGIQLKGGYEIILYRLMQEYTKTDSNQDLIEYLEQVTRMMEKRNC